MEENPLVSIVIPAYNAEAFVKEAIESAYNQSYRPIEVIVIDDGSTDNTWKIINAIKEPNLHLIHQENKGVSAARNVGINRSKGEFIKFLDADDLLLDGLKDQVAHALTLKDNEISVSLFKSKGNIQEFKNWFSMYTPWIPLFPKKALEKVGGFDASMSFGEDMELTFNLQTVGYHFVQCISVSYEYRFAYNPVSLFMIGRSNIDSIYRFYDKYKKDHMAVTSTKEYNRYFISLLYLVPDLSQAAMLYKRLRNDMPFRVNPATINNSRILGYLVWYGAYFFSYTQMMKIIKMISNG